MHRACAVVIAAIMLAEIAGCSALPESAQPVMPSFPGFGEDKGPQGRLSDQGVVVMTAGIEGLECAGGHILLARKSGNGFEAARDVEFDMSWAGAAPVGAVALDPGEYHVVQYACRNGNNVTYVGRSADVPGAVPWKSSHWTRSLAGFQVASGEVLDLGALTLKPGKPLKSGKSKALTQLQQLSAAGERTVELQVGGLSDAAKATLQKDRPALLSQLTARPMAVEPGAAGSATLVKCTLFSGTANTAAATTTTDTVAADAPAPAPGGTITADGNTTKPKSARNKGAKSETNANVVAKMQAMAAPPIGCREAGTKAKKT